jgi:DnaK suppressor protein
MNAHDSAKYRRPLEELRNRLRGDATLVAEEARGPSGGQADGNLSNAPYHLGDGGSDEFLYDMNALLAENEAYLHQEVSDALARLDSGRFGVCESCGESVAVERLEAMPYARYCTKCADANQSGLDVNLDAGRPRTPADTLAPEGSMQEDWRVAENSLNGADGRHTVAIDEHAAGEPGGGGAMGGLAGSNSGDGEPQVADLQDAAGSGAFDVDDARDNPPEAPRSGRSGGAVGGTPARKRSS